MPISIVEAVVAVAGASLVSLLIFHFVNSWWTPLLVLAVFWATGIVVGPLTNGTFIQPADLYDTSELHHDQIVALLGSWESSVPFGLGSDCAGRTVRRESSLRFEITREPVAAVRPSVLTTSAERPAMTARHPLEFAPAGCRVSRNGVRTPVVAKLLPIN